VDTPKDAQAHLTRWRSLAAAQPVTGSDQDDLHVKEVKTTYHPSLADDALDLGRSLAIDLAALAAAKPDDAASLRALILTGHTVGQLSSDDTLAPSTPIDTANNRAAAPASSPASPHTPPSHPDNHWTRSLDRQEPFELLREVGRGGMGVVYLARQPLLNREVAVKTATNKGSLQKFAAEAMVLAHLEHPNIVPVYDLALLSDQRLALAMKFIAGQPWSERLRDPNIPLDDHLQVLMSVCNAIGFAHSKHILHLDIKPDNVLVGEFGEVLVVDWGIALDFSDPPRQPPLAPHRDSLLSPCGTPAYMAPELARGNPAQIGPQTDIYLLGAVLYEALTGRAPHDLGTGMIHSLFSALAAEPPDFTNHPNAPAHLRAMCTRAMKRDPSDRFTSVAAFQQALRDFHTHAESARVCQRAHQHLADARALSAVPTASRDTLYNDFSEAVASFSQARMLWPQNSDALDGEANARLDFAHAAAQRGDFGFAEVQLRRLLSSSPPFHPTINAQATKALSNVQADLLAQTRSRATLRRMRLTLAAAAAALIIGLAISSVWINRQRQAADDAHALAASRLSDIQRLSDVKRLQDLLTASRDLWPATPPLTPSLQQWLSDAHDLLQHRADHLQRLDRLRAAAASSPPSLAEQWELDVLTDLTTSLDSLASHHVPSVQARLDFAQTITHRSLSDHAADWDAAIQAIASPPRASGRRSTPPRGLIPLGPDPDSTLWEFAHLASGPPPSRGPDGHLALSDDMGVVLVLLPGATARIGASLGPAGTPFSDPDARPSEGPPHDVTLAPFFIGKYEMTQAQWLRVEEANPSAYLPGLTTANHTITTRHPVEQVSHAEALDATRKLDLTLPTEAQWEYATRAGTSTIYWTGDDPESLQGALNIADRFCQENGGPGSWRYEMFLNDGFVTHAPVGMFRPNPFGLHDTAGNVWEWCLDRYGDYSLPTAPDSGARITAPNAAGVFRGGGFRASRAHARSADRYSLYTSNDYRGYDIGLRPARLLTPPP
jgi:serine/threonine protein kinase/formylglycine-generating enzyme required for sulfatase activity